MDLWDVLQGEHRQDSIITWPSHTPSLTGELWWYYRSPSITDSSDPVFNTPQKVWAFLFLWWIVMGSFGKELREYLLYILVVALQVLPQEDLIFPLVWWTLGLRISSDLEHGWEIMFFYCSGWYWPSDNQGFFFIFPGYISHGIP